MAVVLKVALIQLNLTGSAADNLDAACTHLTEAADLPGAYDVRHESRRYHVRLEFS